MLELISKKLKSFLNFFSVFCNKELHNVQLERFNEKMTLVHADKRKCRRILGANSKRTEAKYEFKYSTEQKQNYN